MTRSPPKCGIFHFFHTKNKACYTACIFFEKNSMSNHIFAANFIFRFKDSNIWILLGHQYLRVLIRIYEFRHKNGSYSNLNPNIRLIPAEDCNGSPVALLRLGTVIPMQRERERERQSRGRALHQIPPTYHNHIKILINRLCSQVDITGLPEFGVLLPGLILILMKTSCPYYNVKLS